MFTQPGGSKVPAAEPPAKSANEPSTPPWKEPSCVVSSSRYGWMISASPGAMRPKKNPGYRAASISRPHSRRDPRNRDSHLPPRSVRRLGGQFDLVTRPHQPRCYSSTHGCGRECGFGIGEADVGGGFVERAVVDGRRFARR